MKIITDNTALTDFCTLLKEADTLYVDTEFIRERTYYPQLCLIQLGDEENAALIDPLAKGIDLAPLMELLNNPNSLKVMHAARQDMEIFSLLSGKPPGPLFDTQIAAAFCGYGDQIAYDRLVKQISGNTVEKASQFTDWARRPLSDAQMEYALSDVTFLPALFAHLYDKLEEKGRLDWVKEETAYLLEPSLYESPPEDAWQRVRLKRKTPRSTAAIQRLAAWREQQAQQRDIPKGRILKDDALADIAATLPASPKALRQGRMFNHKLSNDDVDILADMMREVKELPEAQLPANAPPREHKQTQSGAAELLKVLLKLCAEREKLAPRLIASAAELERIAAGETEDIPCLHGWRYELFGCHAEALLTGKTLLGFVEGELALVTSE